MDLPVLLTAVLWPAAGLLVASGGAKLLVPDQAMATLHRLRLPSGRIAARVVGLVEIAVGGATILAGGALAAAALGALYLALTAVALGQRARQQTCGCFGAARIPVTRTHLAVNASAAVAGLVAAIAGGVASIGSVGSDAGALPALTGALLVVAGAAALRLVLLQRGEAALRRRAAEGRPFARTA